MKTRIVALVPMRHQSERVTGKNYRPCADQPLYHYIIRSLLECPQIDEIVVDTDSEAIIEGLAEHFPAVRVIERPEHLHAGTVPMNEVLLHDTSQVEADFYLQTHSTNPLLSSATINQAIDTFLEIYPTYDSLFSATRLQTRLWDGLGRPLNHNQNILLRTQDLPPIFEENSCIYIFSRLTLENRHNRIGERPYLFEVDRKEAWDIDEELDFILVDYLLQSRRK